ncbi:hypothetical protein [Leptospira interrogans]|uniref:hypothetical protein n=1 Tax=Leptospira interrogans TaxID=173 RepID=UPI0002BADE0C|nr:hypothetical protein [Leptospira interrogans]
MKYQKDYTIQMQIAEAFMKKDKVLRFLEILKKSDRSQVRKFIGKENYIDWSKIITVPFEKELDIFNTYKINHSSTVYILSRSIEFNEKHFNLRDAIYEIIGREITSIISILPGKLALYESESQFSGFLIRR